MKILSIGSDRKLFEKQSPVRARIKKYSGQVDELHIIIFATQSLGLKRETCGNNVFLYPTNSKSRWHYIRDAIRIGKTLPKPDIVTTQDPAESGFVGVKLAKFHNARLQLQVHTDIFSKHFRNSSLLNNLRARVAQWLFPKADCIRVVSERIKHGIIAQFGEHKRLPEINVLPIFVLHEEKQTLAHDVFSQFEKVVLMVSRLEPEKDIMRGIAAFEKIAKGAPDSGLVIVGDGSERERLERYIERRNLSERVIFLGWQNDVASFYKEAYVYMLTSRFEGYGRTLVEAAQAGCSIVTTNVGIAEYVFLNEQSALVCPAGDTDSLAHSLYRLLTNNGLRLSIVAEAQRALDDHMDGMTESEYLERYTKLWSTCGT